MGRILYMHFEQLLHFGRRGLQAKDSEKLR